MEDDNKKYYFVKLEDGDIVDTFRALVLKNTPVKVWMRNEHESGVEDYSIKSFHADKMYVTLEPKKTLFHFTITRKEGKSLFFRFGDEKMLTFTTGTLVREKGEQRLYLKDTIFRCQKRMDYRLVANSFHKIVFKIGAEGLEVFDLSANGVGILVSKSDKMRFGRGKRFEDTTVILNEKSYHIPLVEVVSVWEERTALFKITGNLEIGMQFYNMSPGEEERLSRDIHSLARKAEMRKILHKSKSEKREQ